MKGTLSREEEVGFDSLVVGNKLMCQPLSTHLLINSSWPYPSKGVWSWSCFLQLHIVDANTNLSYALMINV
uniref:Uncharacterized protein n=1 Tax=Rhizophora mucronata TaxID=61149 RepID=A0A2P2IIN3_RHIMU